MPRFSVVMANYNKGRYIDEAIRSVINQTFTDWELIFVDDASTDDSLERVQTYLGDSRIQLYTKTKNEGIVKAQLFGLTKVSSGIVGIVDSDDALMSEAIEKVYFVHTERPELGLVLSGEIKCDSTLKPIETSTQPPKYKRDPLLWLRGGTHFRTFKLSAYNKTTGLGTEFQDGAEDWDIIFKLEEVAPGFRVDEPLYLYRQLASSASQAPERRKRGNCLLALALYRAYLRRRGTALPNIPQKALLGWLTMAVRYFIELGEPAKAFVYVIRGLRIAPFESAIWRSLIASARAGVLSVPLLQTLGPPASGSSGFTRIRSYSVRELQSKTGNIEPDRVVCIPLIHKEDHCLFGGDTLIFEDGRYRVTFEISIDPYLFAEDPLVILDVYENLRAKKVLAERRIEALDIFTGAPPFTVEFVAREGQRVEFRAFWRENCFLVATGLVLERADHEFGALPASGAPG